MNVQDLQTLVDFHYWARDLVLASAESLDPEPFTRALGNSFPSVRDTLGHLYGADWIWRSRWEGTSPDALPDPSAFADVPSIRDAWRVEEQRVRAVLARFDEAGIHTLVHYRRNGQQQAQPFAHTLQHLVNHGTYHRGQVTTMLRQLGATPPVSMDLITFYRERATIPT